MPYPVKEHRQLDDIYTLGERKKIPKIILEMLPGVKYLGKDREDRDRLRIVHSDHTIRIEIITNGSFQMGLDNIREIERFWDCSFLLINTYKPRLTDTFEKLGNVQYDENFIRIYFEKNDGD